MAFFFVFYFFLNGIVKRVAYKSSYSSSVSVLQAFDPVRYKAFGFAMANGSSV